jgi:Skp family chaperone for outer membrane proteins
MKSMVAGVFALTLLAPVLQPLTRSRPSASIAYISSQKILTESNDAKAAAKRLEELRQSKAQEIKAKQKALEATRLELVNAGGVFSASKRAQLKTREGEQQSELQRATQQAQIDFQSLQGQLQTELRRKFTPIVADAANRKGIQVVFNADTALIWTSAGTDLTAEVLERLNAASSEKATTK